LSVSFLPVERGAIADAGDLEALAIAVGHADDHVVDQGPGQAVELLVGLLLGRAGDDEGAVLRLTVMSGWSARLRVPLGPLTVSWRPSIVTSTVDGTVMGRRPIRDMSSPTRRTRGLRRPAAPDAPAGRS
jgi:hypothetical protein